LALYHQTIQLNRRFKILTPNISEFAFILGSMKSGTSTLWSFLIQHPNICKCLFKEPNFWTTAADPPDLESYYRLWLPNPLRRQIALEASPQYTASPPGPNIADRLRKLPGRKHFLYLVRNPLDRIESHIAHQIGKGRLGLDEASGLRDLTRYVSLSKYHAQLSLYRAAFPDTPVMVLDFQELKSEPMALVRRVCKVLEIDPDHRFKPIGTKNPRKEEHGASQFKLSETQQEAVRQLLDDDMRKFELDFGFPVKSWGFG
jgi:hypothetical protein